MKTVFADTSYFLALLSDKDRAHGPAAGAEGQEVVAAPGTRPEPEEKKQDKTTIEEKATTE